MVIKYVYILSDILATNKNSSYLLRAYSVPGMVVRAYIVLIIVTTT